MTATFTALWLACLVFSSMILQLHNLYLSQITKLSTTFPLYIICFNTSITVIILTKYDFPCYTSIPCHASVLATPVSLPHESPCKGSKVSQQNKNKKLRVAQKYRYINLE